MLFLLQGVIFGSQQYLRLLIHEWDAGRDLCVDVSIVSLFCRGWAVLRSREVARRAEEKNISSYEACCSAN